MAEIEQDFRNTMLATQSPTHCRANQADALCSTFASSGSIAAVFASLVVLQMTGVLQLFAIPMYDDYVTSGRAQQSGLWNLLAYFYLHLTGRWTHVLTLGIPFLWFDVARIYPYLLIIISIISTASLHVFFRALDPRLPRKVALFFSLLVLSLWYSITGWRTMESVLWWTGAVTYQLSMACALFLIAIGLSALRATRVRPLRGLRVAGSVALTVYAVGLHELVGMLICAAATVMCGVAFARKRPERWLLAVILGTALLGFASVVVAPGNWSRAQEFSAHGDHGAALRAFMEILHTDVRSWILDPRVISCIILLATWALLARSSSTDKTVRRYGIQTAGGVLTVGVACFVVWLAFGCWAMGKRPFHRVLEASFLVILMTGIWSLWSLVSHVDTANAPKLRRTTQIICGIAGIAFAVATVTSEFSRNAPVCILKDLYPWSTLAKARNLMAERAGRLGVSDIVFPKGPDAPRCYMGLDITPWPNSATNGAYASYYGLHAVYAEPPLKEPYSLIAGDRRPDVAIRNGRFEQLDANGNPIHWNIPEGAPPLSLEPHKENIPRRRLKADVRGKMNCSIITQTLPVKPERIYTLKAAAQTHQIRGRVCLEVRDALRGYTYFCRNGIQQESWVTGTANEATLALQFSVPEDVDSVDVALRHFPDESDDGPGTLWVEALEMEERLLEPLDWIDDLVAKGYDLDSDAASYTIKNGNLLQNGSFETVPGGWPSFWNGAPGMSAAVDAESTVIDGNASLCVKLTDATNLGIPQVITTTPNSVYLVKGWIRTENVGGRARLEIQCGDARGPKYIGASERVVTGTTGWTPLQAIVELPADTTQMAVFVRIINAAKGSTREGTAWFDRYQCYRLGPARNKT